MSRSLIPNSTQIPDVILDHWMAHLSGAELKVVLYIARRTYGFGKEGDTISLKQIVSGIKTKDGRQLDQGTGLNKDTVCKVLPELEKKNIILREQRQHEEYGDLANYYRLNLECEFGLPAEDEMPLRNDLPPVSDFPTRGSKNPVPPRVGKSDTGRPKIRHGGVGKSDTQETDQQETVQQETAAAEAPTARPTRRRVAKGTAAAALTLEIPEPLTPEAEALAEALKEAGLNQADAERFARTKPAEAERQLQYLPFKANLDSPGAYLRAAIEGGFTPPKEFAQAQAKKEQEHKAREEAERKKAAEALRLAQEATEAAQMDEAIARLEIEAPAAFQDFEAFVAAERAKALDKPFIKPGSRTEQIMLNSFGSPEKRRELYQQWRAQRQMPLGATRSHAGPQNPAAG